MIGPAEFQFTLTLDGVLTAVTLFATASTAFVKFGGRFNRLEMGGELMMQEISELKQQQGQLLELLTTQKLQDERIAQLQRWYDELRRGIGFISGPPNCPVPPHAGRN